MVKEKKTVKKVKNTVEFIKKRDGSLVTFDTENIAKAVWKAMKASGEGTEKDALIVAKSVHIELDKKCANDQDDCTPTAVSYTHLRAHETDSYLVCRLLLEK